MRHSLHPEADAEFAEAVRHYAAANPELGRRFFREIEQLILQVCANPQQFFRFHPPARRALSRDFPYSVVYLQQPDRIWIVAVMHAKRAPGYWKRRIK